MSDQYSSAVRKFALKEAFNSGLTYEEAEKVAEEAARTYCKTGIYVSKTLTIRAR